MKRSLVILTVFYCLGIVLAEWLRINFWIITALMSVIFIVLIWWGKKSFIFSVLVLCLTLLVGCLSLRNSWILSACHLRNLVVYQSSSLYFLEGFIVSQPEFKDNQGKFILRAKEIQVGKLKYKCCGEVLVKMDFEQVLNYGDNLRLIGNLSRPASFGGNQSYKNFLARQDIYLTLSIKEPRQISKENKVSGLKLIRGCLALRARLEEVISRQLPVLPASILSAMVLGQKRNLPWLVNNSMVKSGTVHILVVSGFNVGIVAFMFNLLFKIMRFARKGRLVLIAICLVVYCLITGATNPVVRATVMGLIFLLAYFLKRDPDIYNSLVIAALFILLIKPRQLFDIGFQLSFISVLAIVYLYPKLKYLAHLESCKIKIIRLLGEGCLVSFSAWLGTLVIIALNFRIIAPVTVLANILIVPLATLITLCGFVLVLAGLISPDLANFFSLPTAGLITLLLNINANLIKLPLAFFYL